MSRHVYVVQIGQENWTRIVGVCSSLKRAKKPGDKWKDRDGVWVSIARVQLNRKGRPRPVLTMDNWDNEWRKQ